MNPAKVLSWLNQFFFLVLFTALFCSFRAVSSISIGLIIITGICKTRIESGHFFHSYLKNPFLVGCLLFYLLSWVSLIYTHNTHEGWNDIRVKSGLVFTPLAVCSSGYMDARTWKRLFSSYCIILALTACYCLLMAFFKYRQTDDPSIFYYHALVSFLKQHAVYFSLFVFVALVFLLESLRKNDFVIHKALHIGLAVFLSCFLVLLLSKLVIIFYLVYLFYYFIQLLRSASNRAIITGLFLLFVIASGLILLTRNPLNERFNEITQGDIRVVEQQTFNPAERFNGLQFRLLQWKFVTEIINENQRWLIGVSPGDAQSFLDQKYISTKMYTGDPAKADHGFLGYNTHNEFLETFLQTGLFGVLILLFTCISLIRMAWQRKNRLLSFVTILLLAWLFSESAFETQYGILIFTFFPLFIFLNNPGAPKSPLPGKSS